MALVCISCYLGVGLPCLCVMGIVDKGQLNPMFYSNSAYKSVRGLRFHMCGPSLRSEHDFPTTTSYIKALTNYFVKNKTDKESSIERQDNVG